MGARIRSDSRSGEVYSPTRSDITQRISDVNSINSERELSGQGQDDAYRRLPGADEYKQINWLGSSYSGADIKAVVHMYTDAQDNELAKLREEKELAESLVKGCTNLKGQISILATNTFSGTTFQERKDAFISMTLLDANDLVEQKAIHYLLDNVLRRGDATLIGVARMRRAIDDILQTNLSISQQLSSALKELGSLRNNAQSTISLGTLQTLSLQTHREKYAVRALGHSYAKSYVRNQRTIAGSMIFTVFNEHAFAPLMRAMGGISGRESIWKNAEISTLLPDQLPPLDITVAFANEYGSLSELRIFGVEFMNDGMTMSIEDILTENVITFVARDCDVLTKAGMVRLSRLQRGMLDIDVSNDNKASSLLFNNQSYLDYIDKIGVRRRLLNR